MKGLQCAVAKSKKAHPHIRLIALNALLLQIQRQLRRDDGFDIVGLLQSLHFDVIVHHHQHILQVRPRIGTYLHLVETAGFHVATQQGLEDNAHSGFALAALAGDQQHFLSAGGGDQAVAEELLQGGNVLRVQELGKEGQPLGRLWRIRAVGHRQTVPAEVLFLREAAIQIHRSI